MHAFNTYVSDIHGIFSKPFEEQFADFQERVGAAENPVARLAKARFNVGDRVLIKVGVVPRSHNSGYTLEEGYAIVKERAMTSDFIAVNGEHTRVVYKIEFEKPVAWIDIGSNYRAKCVVVEQSSLMVKA